MIQIDKLSFSYSRSRNAALVNIDLEVEAGSVFGLLGPNGAGKTTLLGLLNGLLPCPAGAVSIDGIDIRRPHHPLLRKMSLVPQEYAFYPTLTVRENLRFFAGIQRISGGQMDKRVALVIDTSSLQDKIDARANTLSGGLKRRLNLAIGLLNEPVLLFLDEPTVGIDPHSRRFILDSIKAINQQGTTIIYTSHYMEEVEYLCDHVAIIDRGRVLAKGSLNHLLRSTGGALLSIDTSVSITPEQHRSLTSLGYDCQGSRITIASSFDIYTVMKQLQTHQIGISRIHYGKQNLEDLFLDLTKRSLRD